MKIGMRQAEAEAKKIENSMITGIEAN